jgi:acyl-CoA reductase-like NAD-dependent aldehyde dehydrogenase
MENFNLLIKGANTNDGELIVESAFDRTSIGKVVTADAVAVEKALVTAYKLYHDRSQWLTLEKRLDILRKTIEIMKSSKQELAVLAASEGGKPLVDSLVEVQRAIEGVECCVETMKTISGTEIPMGLNAASLGKLAFTTREPLGVVAAVSAFNHPLNLIIHQVAPAVAVGCPVIVKPAEDTPLSCMRFVEILREAGLPEEWCQAFVVNNLDNATKLVTDKRLSFFSFIGSGKVGWFLRSKLAPGVHCALEHGGAAPVIFDQTAEISTALPKLVKGGFYHAGQVCVSVQRVFAHESVAQELAKKLAEHAAKLKVGDPTKEDTEVGPLIRVREVDRVAEWVDEAAKAGAKVLCGGKRISETCYEPTVLYNPPDDVKVSSAEIFGPVVCVYSYEEIDKAIERANQLPFCFQASVFSKDVDVAMHAARRLHARAVMINEHTAFRVDWMPFGGHKDSGMGTGGIPYTINDIYTEKLMVISSKGLE